MKNLFLYLLFCVLVAIAASIFCRAFPKDNRAMEIHKFILKNKCGKRCWLIVLAILALPVAAIIWLLLWVFSDDLGVGKSQNLRQEKAKMIFVQQALMRIFNDQPSVFPIVAPNTVPICAVVYKRTSGFRVCVGRKNVPISSDDAEIFKLHLNSEIERYFEQGRFPVFQGQNLAGVDLRFKVLEVHACKGYWEIFTGPSNFVDPPDPDCVEVDESDDDF